MASFTPDQWLVLLLAFVLGLILGMAFLASPKWKGRYREEVTRRGPNPAPQARKEHLPATPTTTATTHTNAKAARRRRRPAGEGLRDDETARRDEEPGPL